MFPLHMLPVGPCSWLFILTSLLLSWKLWRSNSDHVQWLPLIL